MISAEKKLTRAEAGKLGGKNSRKYMPAHRARRIATLAANARWDKRDAKSKAEKAAEEQAV